MASRKKHTSLEVELVHTVRFLTKILVINTVIVLAIAFYLMFINLP